jgi:hypothetical protein
MCAVSYLNSLDIPSTTVCALSCAAISFGRNSTPKKKQGRTQTSRILDFFSTLARARGEVIQYHLMLNDGLSAPFAAAMCHKPRRKRADVLEHASALC